MRDSSLVLERGGVSGQVHKGHVGIWGMRESSSPSRGDRLRDAYYIKIYIHFYALNMSFPGGSTVNGTRLNEKLRPRSPLGENKYHNLKAVNEAET